jgi:large subunit ribosomal protein L11
MSMGKETIEVLVDGGKATAGPPLGSQLGPLRVNVAEVVRQINERTKDMAGMKVPVKITVDTESKSFSITIGTPPMADLIKKELGIDRGSGETGTSRAGDLSEDQVKKVARLKFGADDQAHINQVKGTCRSMGVTIGKGAVTEEERRAAEEARKRAAEEAAAAEKAAEAAAEGEPGEKTEEKAEEKEEKSEERDAKKEDKGEE